jgi:hypothetical protein
MWKTLVLAVRLPLYLPVFVLGLALIAVLFPLVVICWLGMIAYLPVKAFICLASNNKMELMGYWRDLNEDTPWSGAAKQTLDLWHWYTLGETSES